MFVFCVPGQASLVMSKNVAVHLLIAGHKVVRMCLQLQTKSQEVFTSVTSMQGIPGTEAGLWSLVLL